MTGIATGAMRRWMAAAIAPMLVLSAAGASAGVLDTIKQTKTLRLAVRDDAPPFSFKNASGAPAGFMVDLCRAVAKDMGVKLGVDIQVAYVPVTAADRFDAITSGKADLLCEPTTETLSRRETLDFSIPTFIDGASLIAVGDGPQDFASLAGKKIGVLGGTTTEDELRNTLKSTGMTAEVVTLYLARAGAEGSSGRRIRRPISATARLSASVASRLPESRQIPIGDDLSDDRALRAGFAARR